MRTADLIRLLSLAAIWGASFLFMRIVAPVLGPTWTAELRFAIGGGALFLWLATGSQRLQAAAHWRPYLILGILGSALPASLFAFAALTLPSGYSAILNATTPLWGALIGALVLNEALTGRKLAGMVIGIVGVGFLVRLGPIAFTRDVLIAAAACVTATFCYGVATAYSKKKSATMSPGQLATGTQLGAALLLLPTLPLSAAPGTATPLVAAATLGLGLLCSGVAYLLHFRLIADLGPARALTVTFLIPLFALMWGWLFLHETINLSTLIGCGLVVLATWLVVSRGRS